MYDQIAQSECQSYLNLKMLSKENKSYFTETPNTSREENCNVPIERDSPNENKSTRDTDCSKTETEFLLTPINKLICYLKIVNKIKKSL